MSTLVIVLRVVSLLTFAGPMLWRARAARRARAMPVRDSGSSRAPVTANFAAAGMFFASLLISSGSAEAPMALPLAVAGCLLALAGAWLVLRSRAELGLAWSLLAKADQDAGIVTSGPYRLVRHPIYLGFILLVTGEALAFGSWLAFFVVLFGIVPTFAWRARTEEAILGRTFGERYTAYRQRTRMIIPYLL